MFTYTTDCAAFIDRIVINVWSPEVNAMAVTGKLTNGESRSILAKGRIYGRCVSGNWKLTNNQIAVVYGRVKHFSNVPKAQVTFYSETVPVTGAQVILAMTELLGPRAHFDISRLELTLDTQRVPWWRLRQDVVFRARGWRCLWGLDGRRTFYAGSRASDTQVRVYDKTDKVVRLEFVLRRAYLRSLGITHPLEVVGLRSGQVWHLLSLRTCSAARVRAATGSWWRNPVGRRVLCQWRQRGLPNQLLASALRRGGADPNKVLIKSRQQLHFEKMLASLIW